MSLPELAARARIARLITLYILENHLPFTMDEITYGKFTYKQLAHYGSVSYYSGIVYLQHKHSPVALTLHLADIYKWWKWRESKFIPAVYDYYMARADLIYPVNLESIPAEHMHGIMLLTRR